MLKLNLVSQFHFYVWIKNSNGDICTTVTPALIDSVASDNTFSIWFQDLFKKVALFFDGLHSFEEIIHCTGIARKDFKVVIKNYKEKLAIIMR